MWQSLDFDKEYLFDFETLVFAGNLSMHHQLVTLQRESKTLNRLTTLKHIKYIACLHVFQIIFRHVLHCIFRCGEIFLIQKYEISGSFTLFYYVFLVLVKSFKHNVKSEECSSLDIKILCTVNLHMIKSP